jgi:hypothetical protein
MAIADSTQFSSDSILFINIKSLDIRVLSSPRLAVKRPLAGAMWPEGSGTHRLTQSDGLMLQPLQRDRHAAFQVRTASPSDARNFIDDGIDILLTGDSATAAYAARRLATPPVSLEWDRTWMLVVPGSPAEPARGVSDDSRVNAVRDDLVHDAIRANARRAALPPWIAEPSVCASGTARAPRPRVAYQSDDPVARAIAERMVALASPRSGDGTALVHIDAALGAAGTLTTVPLTDAAFITALRAGSELAFVVSIPSRAARTCSGARAIPLVDTRWQAVIRPQSRRTP